MATVAASEPDRVDILIGVLTPADVDLLVTVDFKEFQEVLAQRPRQVATDRDWKRDHRDRSKAS